MFIISTLFGGTKSYSAVDSCFITKETGLPKKTANVTAVHITLVDFYLSHFMSLFTTGYHSPGLMVAPNNCRCRHDGRINKRNLVLFSVFTSTVYNTNYINTRSLQTVNNCQRCTAQCYFFSSFLSCKVRMVILHM